MDWEIREGPIHQGIREVATMGDPRGDPRGDYQETHEGPIHQRIREIGDPRGGIIGREDAPCSLSVFGRLVNAR
jgi:hypothetical protein